jgi:excisionase family DNA binding protein
MVQKLAEKRADKLLTIGEAAEALKVSQGTLRNWDRAGKLKARRHPMNRYRLYSANEIAALRHEIRGG